MKSGVSWFCVLVALGVLTVPGAAADAPPGGGGVARPAPVVLGLPRLPDADTVLLRTGERREGALTEASFPLRIAEGEVAFPAAALAGLDFTDAANGLVSVVTRDHDRLTGFPRERGLRFVPRGSNAPVVLAVEELLKVALRDRPREPGDVNVEPGIWVELRNGDGFAGALLSDAFQPEPDAGGRRWGFKELARVTFPNVGSGRADLVLTNGQTVAGRPVSAEMEFQLRAGPRLRWHAGRIRQLRKPGELPADFLVRIGVPPDRGLGLESGRGPDPTVMPAGDLVWIPPGEFTMGSPPEERERDLDEGPPTRVVLPEGFWIGRHEVTQAEYEGVVGTNPSRYAGDGRLPVEKLTWTEAMDYCARLTARERASGRLPAAYAYRLPTEAEWEHACRSGSSGRYHFGDEVNPAALAAYAWFGDNSDSTPHPVGTRQANAWGLHDLHGNVLEWCLDAWQGSLPGGTITNRVTVPQGTLRVARGGSWLYPARACRSANRESYGMLNRCSDLGFRVVLARTGDAQP